MNMHMGMGGVGGVPVGMNLNNGGPRVHAPSPPDSKTLLNTYIYDYFLKNDMVECARTMFNSGEADVQTNDGSRRTSPSRRPQKHDADGNAINGIDENAMDTGEGPARKLEDGEEGSKNGLDLPPAKVPSDCPQQSFLLDWWCLFWDIFNARNGSNKGTPAAVYVNHTQQAQRMRNDILRMNPQHNALLGGGPVPSQMLNTPSYPARMMQGGGMMPNGIMHVPDGAGGMGDINSQHKAQQLVRTAMLNNNTRKSYTPPAPTPQQISALNMKSHHMMQAMARNEAEVNEMNGQQPRPQSPATGQNAASPGNNKRVRLENGDYSQVGNGRGGPQGVPQGGSQQAAQTHQLLVASGINPSSLTHQQFAAFQGQNPSAQQKSIQLYAQGLAAHTGRAVSALQGGPMQKGMPNVQQNPGQHGSPMMPQTSDGASMDFYANTTPNGGGMRGGNLTTGTGNHALQDYQMQLMLLEQQNKKRLLLARAEQDNIAHHAEGQRRMDQPAGYQGVSPGRPAPSPQPTGNPKMTGTPKMQNQVGPGSPLPDGQIPQRNSPASMAGFNGQMSQDAHQNMIYQMKDQIPLGSANAGNMPNGAPMMRPPSSVPQFNGQMSPEELQQTQMNPEMARAQQAGRGQPVSWQHQQNVQTVQAQQQQLQQMQQQQQQQVAQQQQQQQQSQQPPQAQQGQPGQPQQVGTPQQARQSLPHQSMPPPSAPANGPATGRTQPSSPQVQNQQPPTPTQSHKSAPKGKGGRENTKKNRPNKKPVPAPVANVVTPLSEPPTPTTPSNPNSFTNNNGPGHPRQNTGFASGMPGQGAPGQPNQQATPNPPPTAPPAPIPQPDPVQTTSFADIANDLAFTDFNQDGDNSLLDNFDFDSFLNNPEDNAGPLSFEGGMTPWATDVVETTSES
ncbi:hypothetical protein RUND412_009671 [Rhizina undulata]